MRRLKIVPAVFLLAALATAVLGCTAIDERGREITSPPDPKRTTQEAVDKVDATTIDPADDTAGTMKVTWVAASGSARQDPIGLLNNTPLDGGSSHVRARRTVKFTPSVTDATSATGKYVYILELAPTDSLGTSYKGTLKIDWTMTIVRAGSKNEFHAVYKGDVTASYDGKGTVISGVVKGTADTTDTFWNGDAKLNPATSSDPFEWTFASQ